MSKPLSFGFASTSWNYGSFYKMDTYKSRIELNNSKKEPASKIFSQQKTVPVKIKSESSKEVANPNQKIKEGMKIVNDAHIKNIFYLKMLDQIGKPDEQEYDKKQKIKRSNSLNRLGIKYDDWYQLKTEQLLVKKEFEIKKKTQEERLLELNQKIKQEYDDTLKDKLALWENKKNDEMKRKKLEKEENERKKRKEKEEKLKKNQERLDDWLRRQAEIIEIENEKKRQIEMANEEYERQKKIEKEQKKYESERIYNDWMMRKNEEKKIISLIKAHEVETKERKDRKYTKNINVVIGPYSNAKILRNLKEKLVQDLNEENEEEDDINEDINNNEDENIEEEFNEELENENE